MKNGLLFILLCFSIAADAQFVSGQKLITARLDLVTSNTTYTSGSNSGNGYVNTSLSLQRFTSPTLLKGFGIGYGYNDSHTNGSSLYYQNNLNAFYEVTKLQLLAKNFYLTYGGNITGAYNFGKQSGTLPSYSNTRGFGASVSGTVGLLYQLNQRWIITGELNNLFTIQYTHNHYEDHSIAVTPGGVINNISSSTTNTVQLNSGLSSFNLNNFVVGISYLLKK